MKTIYFTIAGTCFHHGSEFIKPDMEVKLVKEPDNKVDSEAIKVEMPGLGLIGYVSAQYKTRIGESYSAGRLYDKIGDTATGKVMYVSIPVQFEPVVRSLRATIPESQSHRYCHQKHYSTVLLT